MAIPRGWNLVEMISMQLRVWLLETGMLDLLKFIKLWNDSSMKAQTPTAKGSKHSVRGARHLTAVCVEWLRRPPALASRGRLLRGLAREAALVAPAPASFALPTPCRGRSRA